VILNTLVKQLGRDLDHARTQVGKYISRLGIHYSWYNVSYFNEEIHNKRMFAVRWREEALKLAEEGELSTRVFRTWSKHQMCDTEFVFRIFAVDGVDRLLVRTTAGSNSTRLVELEPERTLAEFCDVHSLYREK